MSDLLSDFLNDRLQPVPVEGVVNGIMDYEKPEENTYNSSDSESESDTEQQEYIKKELSTYFPETEAPCSGGLTDIEDGHEESVLGTDIMELLHVPKVFETYKFDTYYKKELPIDSSRDKILDMINTNSVVIIHGPTGCGKTTQVPQYILDHCRATKSPCNIVVTQPRRIAAINIAQRVCEERGWAIGTVCGYQVGLDKNVGDDVILTYMTTEVLLQKLISQKNLNRFTHVIIDEVHERSKSLDFLLLIVRKYLFTNSSSVKIILMSATMEAQDFAYYFRSISRNNPQQYLLAPVLPVTKKSEYKVSIYYNEHFASAMPPYNFEEPCMHKEQYDVCAKLISLFDKLEENESKLTPAERINGSVLVFLPGFHEIEEMHKVLVRERNTSVLEWEIIPLHSSLAQEHMVKAFQKPRQRCRKIILSTNIAESSVTVPDVNFVIDFCLTKNMTVNEVTKFSSLSLQWASHTNCIQRAGRVGRVANGRVYRVVPTSFYLHEMKQTTVPELQRAPLENVILYMKLLGLNDTPKNVLSLALSPPNLKDVEQCVWHLKEVGALLQTCRGHRTPADGDITFMGRVMGSLPIDIHLSKLILLGHMFSCLDEAVIMAAGCMTKNIFVQNFYDRFRTYRQKLVWADGSHSDFMILLNLYNVWLSMKRDRAFSSSHQEIGWCKTHFVNLKGLREWDILIQEIHSRLKRLNIQKLPGPSSIPLSIVEKPMVLKVIICGAFYPYYFIKSSDFGNVDAKEAVKILNGRDPCNTVYFTNMKMNQPGQIYVRQIKKLMNCEDKPNVQIGFDPQSTKVFVEFKATRQPEQVTIDGRQYIATVASNIAVDVYEAVRKRQMRVPFVLRILPDSKAWEFANMTQAKRQIAESEDVNCFTTLDYSPLPTLDIEYITVTVTHIIDAGHFYCQNWNEETRMLLDQIFAALNGPGVFLEPAGEKIKVNSDIYAALFNEDGKFYRCKVIDLTPGQPNVAQVCFIDYGNVQRVPKNRLYKLPENSEPCRVQPIAMCCVLSGVQPDLVLNPKALWSESVNNILRKKTTGVLLNAKVFSVVDEVVHLELFLQNPGRNSVSFNQWLINEGLGQKCEESQRSKMDHEMRLKVQSSEDPSNMSALFNKNQIVTSYADFEAPESSEATEIIELKGPFSPLEMKVCGLVQASQGAPVHVDGDSVNAVMLDDNPEDYHATLLVAGQVSQSSKTSAVKISQTTIMPNIPGFPMLMCLLFCPQMEPKLTPDGSRVASILCGLGYKEVTQRANFPMHDICLVLDTDLRSEIITKINALRYYMNEAIKIMSQIQEELARPEEMYTTQRFLKDELFHLLHMRQQTVDRVNVRYPDVWNKGLDNMEILRIDMDDDEEAIWSYLWFVKFGEDRLSKMSINKNLDELTQIARRTAPEREIKCELCNSATLRNISDVRIHLFREEHKSNLAKYLNQNK